MARTLNLRGLVLRGSTRYRREATGPSAAAAPAVYQELIRSRAPNVAGERLPAVLPVVLYNGTGRWTAASEMRALITPVGPWLAPYQPVQRYYLLDLRHLAADDLPYRNLLRVVARLEQSRSPRDVERAVQALRHWLPAELLAPVADPERLAEVGDWLVRSDTAAEFLARFGPA